MYNTSLVICGVPFLNSKVYLLKADIPKIMSSSETLYKDDYINQAKLAEAAGRPDEMVMLLKKAAQTGQELTEPEIQLLSYGYKTLLKLKREQYRKISNVLSKLSNTDKRRDIVKEFLDRITSEIRNLCEDIGELLEKNLLKSAKDIEVKTCCLMMKADYLRYLAEISSGENKLEFSQNSLKVYQEAYELSRTRLLATNPLRLNLALNYSVLQFDILRQNGRACNIAKQAFDEAVQELESLPDEQFRRTTMVMKVLSENLNLWETGVPDPVNPANDEPEDFFQDA